MNAIHAIEDLRQRAEAGEMQAQYDLGWRYSAGRDVQRDDAEAEKWLRMAADRGFAKSQNILGMMYAVGHGVPQDYMEAAKWLRKAADQGWLKPSKTWARCMPLVMAHRKTMWRL